MVNKIVKNKKNIIFIFLIILYIFFAVNILTFGHNWGDDFASYIMQAESLISGSPHEFYEKNSFTINNSDTVLGPIVYPWGYPIILSIFLFLFNINLLALKIPNFIFFVLFLLTFYKLLSQRLSQTEKLLLISIITFNPHFLLFHDNILSDIPFLFFSTISIYFIDRTIRKNFLFSSPWLNSIFLGFLIFFSTFIRTIGIVLLFTYFVCQFYLVARNKKWTKNIKKELIPFLMPYLIFAFFWIISSLIFPSGESSYRLTYNSSLINLLDVIRGNFNYYFNLLSDFFSGIPVRSTFYGFLLAFFVLGIIYRFTKDYLFVFFSVIYIGILTIWPAQQGLRFIFPIIPFFIYFSFQGMKQTISNINTIKLKVGVRFNYIFWIIILMVFLGKSSSFFIANLNAGRSIEGPFDKFSMETYNFIKEQTSEDSIIVFHKPRIMRMMTTRNTVAATSCETLSIGDYLIILKENILEEILTNCPQVQENIFENDKFIIYELD